METRPTAIFRDGNESFGPLQVTWRATQTERSGVGDFDGTVFGDIKTLHKMLIRRLEFINAEYAASYGVIHSNPFYVSIVKIDGRNLSNPSAKFEPCA
ncbi:MAG TPA: hypothetical protein VE959_05195 [Bryobacteraceae bacterium]|nr:hypothetical protein [Bryobacteraceae bacterium]